MNEEQDNRRRSRRNGRQVPLVLNFVIVLAVALLLNTDTTAALVGRGCGSVERTEGNQRSGFSASVDGRLTLWYWHQHPAVTLKFTLWLQQVQPPNEYTYPVLTYTTSSQINKTMKIDFRFSKEDQATTVMGKDVPEGSVYEGKKLVHLGVVSDKAVVWADCTNNHDIQSNPTERRPPSHSIESTPVSTPPNDSTPGPTPSLNPSPNPIPSTSPTLANPNPNPSSFTNSILNPTLNPNSKPAPTPSTNPSPNPTSPTTNPIPDSTTNANADGEMVKMPVVVVVLVVVLVVVVMMVLTVTIVAIYRKRDDRVDEVLSTMDSRYQSLLRHTDRPLSPPANKPNRHPTPPPVDLKTGRQPQINSGLDADQHEEHIYEELSEYGLPSDASMKSRSLDKQNTIDNAHNTQKATDNTHNTQNTTDNTQKATDNTQKATDNTHNTTDNAYNTQKATDNTQKATDNTYSN